MYIFGELLLEYVDLSESGFAVFMILFISLNGQHSCSHTPNIWRFGFSGC